MRREAAKNPSKRASGYDNEISLITVKTRIAIKSSVNETVVDIQTKYVDVISKFETVLSDLVTDPTLSKFHIIFNGVINDGLRLYCPNGSVEAENAFSCSKFIRKVSKQKQINYNIIIISTPFYSFLRGKDFNNKSI